MYRSPTDYNYLLISSVTLLNVPVRHIKEGSCLVRAWESFMKPELVRLG